MSTITFEPWPKIARRNREITITEKLDGTNAAVLIVKWDDVDHVRRENGIRFPFDGDDRNAVAFVGEHIVFAQSRTRFITPGKSTDNYGFAHWVENNAEGLVAVLGEGRHYGEWWGAGIQSKYGLTGSDKRFSLFNVHRWEAAQDDLAAIPGLGVVPVLFDGPFSQLAIDHSLDILRKHGSIAAPGFDRPEGIVVFHTASRESYKVTLEGDEAPKGAAGHAADYSAVAA